MTQEPNAKRRVVRAERVRGRRGGSDFRRIARAILWINDVAPMDIGPAVVATRLDAIEFVGWNVFADEIAAVA